MNIFNTRFILNEKRFGWLDYDRGISIILVTYRHCFESLTNTGINLKAFPIFEYINVFLFGFRMPLFFIASGIFISSSIDKKGLSNYSSSRFKTILYPLLLWGIIQISLQLAFSSYANIPSDPVNYLNLIINPRETGQFWYLNTLFFVGIIYATLKVKLKMPISSQIILGITLYFFVPILRIDGFNLGFLMDIFQFYIFFCIGDGISKFMKDPNTVKFFSSYKTLLFLTPIFIFIQFFFTKINLSNHSDYYIEHKMPLFFFVVAIVGCTLSINISFLLKKNNSLKFLRIVGYNSIHIYCIQIIAMALGRIIFINLFKINYPPILILLVLLSGILIPMVFYNLALRVNIWWLFSLKKPVEEINYMEQNKMLLKI